MDALQYGDALPSKRLQLDRSSSVRRGSDIARLHTARPEQARL